MHLLHFRGLTIWIKGDFEVYLLYAKFESASKIFRSKLTRHHLAGVQTEVTKAESILSGKHPKNQVQESVLKVFHHVHYL